MSRLGRVILGATVIGACAVGVRAEDRPDPLACSLWLAAHPAGKESNERRRGCVVAVASTYIDAEENSAPADHQLLADDVSRHRIGTLPDFKPGNRAKIIADQRHDVIAAIRNRRWTVEGDEAWILYEGYLKANPDRVGFTVVERITLANGLIREILVADIALAK